MAQKPQGHVLGTARRIPADQYSGTLTGNRYLGSDHVECPANENTIVRLCKDRNARIWQCAVKCSAILSLFKEYFVLNFFCLLCFKFINNDFTNRTDCSVLSVLGNIE